MADVLESGGAGAVGAASVDWQKRCIALEMQLLRFRLQAGKIRELLAEKMQELEQRVTEADQRAESAEKQIHVMEEKLKSANIQTSESESSLYRKYQDLTNQVQEKDAVIKRLEIQLEKQILVRAQEAKIIEEKAAKIKDWVTFKLREMEQENQQLKMANLKHTEQIMLLQDKLQALLEKPASSGSPATSPVMDTHLVPNGSLFPPSCPGTPPAQDDSWRQTGPRGAASNIKTSPTDVKRSPEQATKGICHGDLAAHNALSQGRSREGPSSPVSIGGPELPVCPEGQAGCSDRDNSSDELNSKFRSQCLHSSSSSSSSSSAYEMAHGPSSPESPHRITPKSPLLSRSPSTNNPFPNPPQPLVHQSGTSMTLPKVRTPLTPRDSIQLVKKHYSQPQPSLDRLHHLNINIDIMTPSSNSSTLKSTGTATSPFSQKATQISSVPLPDDDSGSEDDSSSLASLRTSILSPDKKGSVPGSPRAVKRGVSMSSISSESDYAIPPDAYSLDSDYSEPEHKVQRTSSYSCESTGPEMLEKSGYLLKMGSQVKAWKRRWFILRNGEILYYKSPVKHGHSKLVWCSLVGKVFYYYRNQEDKLPLGQLQMREASVQEVDRSCDSDEDYETGSRGFLSSHCTLVVQPRDQSPTYLLIGTKQEKDTWLYHLSVAAGSSATLKVGTEYEQLIGKLLDAEGDPGEKSITVKHKYVDL
eukprot:superscaffoldBa00003819_g17760